MVGELRGAGGRVEGNTQRHLQSFEKIESRLDKVQLDVLQRRRRASNLSDTKSRATLEQEIMNDNITGVDPLWKLFSWIFEQGRSYISAWQDYVRGTISHQELLKDITNNPWKEGSRFFSLQSVQQAFPMRNDSVRNGE